MVFVAFTLAIVGLYVRARPPAHPHINDRPPRACLLAALTFLIIQRSVPVHLQALYSEFASATPPERDALDAELFFERRLADLYSHRRRWFGRGRWPTLTVEVRIELRRCRAARPGTAAATLLHAHFLSASSPAYRCATCSS